MSGPRIQLSTIDGYENGGHASQDATRLFFSNTIDATDTNRRPWCADAYLLDMYDGRQGFSSIYWQPGNTSYNALGCKIRYALKTTTPDTYLIVSIYQGDYNYPFGFVYNFAKVGNYPLSSGGFPNLTVELNTDEWVLPGQPQQAPGTVSNSNTNIVVGSVDFREWIQNTNGTNIDGFTYTGAQVGFYTQSALSGNTYTLQVRGGNTSYYSMRILDSSRSITPLLPLDMAGRKFGGPGDKVMVNPAGRGAVYKVYSRAKGCMCLKSFLNGEIPILNE